MTNALFLACKTGDINIVRKLINKGATNWDYGLQGACFSGNIDLVRLMLEKGACPLKTYGLKYACQYAYRDIVDLLLSKGCTAIWWGLEGACIGGHLDLIEKMCQFPKGLWKSDNLNYIFITGNVELVRTIMAKYPFTISEQGIRHLFESGNIQLINIISAQYPTLISNNNLWAILGAFANGNPELISKVLHKEDDDILKRGLKYAAINGHKDLVISTIKKIKSIDQRDLREIIIGVIKSRNMDMLKLLVSYEKDIIENYASSILANGDITFKVCEYGHEEMLEFISERGDLVCDEIGFGLACTKGHINIIKKLIRLKKIRTRAYDYALEEAISFEHVDIAAFLLILGARAFSAIDPKFVPYLTNKHVLCWNIQYRKFFTDLIETENLQKLQSARTSCYEHRKRCQKTSWNIYYYFVCSDVCTWMGKFIGNHGI